MYNCTADVIWLMQLIRLIHIFAVDAIDVVF